MRPLYEDKAVVAVGEIGLDHHWPLPAREQYELFEAQLQLAAELDLPVSVHDREAHAEVYELLRSTSPAGCCTVTAAAPRTPPGSPIWACAWASAGQ